MVRCNHATGAGHVAHDDGWVAGHMTRHVLGDDPRQQVIAAAGCRTHHECQGLAAIEILGGFCPRLQGQGDRKAERTHAQGCSPHGSFLPVWPFAALKGIGQ